MLRAEFKELSITKDKVLVPPNPCFGICSGVYKEKETQAKAESKHQELRCKKCLLRRDLNRPMDSDSLIS